MTRVISMQDTEWFTPEGAEGRRYLLGPLDRRAEIRIELELVDRCGEMVTPDERRQAIRDGIIAVYPPEAQAAPLAIVDRFEAALADLAAAKQAAPPGATNGTAPTEVRTAKAALEAVILEMLKLQRTLSRQYQPLRSLLRQQMAEATEVENLRCEFGIRDWEGIRLVDGTPAPCARFNGRLTEQAMALIPGEDVPAIARRVATMATLTEALVGESASPPGVLDTPTSPSTD